MQIDRQTGGVRSINLYGKKVNLLSQRLALRTPGMGGVKTEKVRPARYSEMIADEVSHAGGSRIRGSIRSRGRLVDNGKEVARFEQTFEICRGIPRVEIEILIEPTVKLSSSSNHYFCNRFAWKDDVSDIVCNALDSKLTVLSDWFEATNFVEIHQGDHCVTMLTGGLPYHRRVSRRMLDSLLIVGRETQRRFKIALEVNKAYPAMSVAQWMSPSFVFPIDDPATKPGGWLFHFNCKNVMAKWWRPIWENESAGGKLTGVSMRLQETEGRAGELKIRCPRPVSNAARNNFDGGFVRAIDVDAKEKDIIPIEFHSNELFQISIYWTA